jgi:hypothetical protein
MILFPTLVQADVAIDPQFLAAEPATTGPLLIDIDEATGGGPTSAAEPEVNFRDRWSAMTAAWIPVRP